VVFANMDKRIVNILAIMVVEIVSYGEHSCQSPEDFNKKIIENS